MSSRALRVGVRAFDLGSSVALALLVIFVVAVLAAPHVAGWRYGILRSGSMSPAMPAGSAIVVAPVGAPDVRPGDVITYHSLPNPELLVTHRVVTTIVDSKQRISFLTQGDANENSDLTPVTADRLVGRVIFDAPYAGQISQRLRSPLAFVLLIALPAALIVLLELKELALGVQDLRRGRKGNVGKTVAEET